MSGQTNGGGYANAISKGQGSAFVRLLLLWRGSLYKLVWSDLLIYLSVYYTINLIYRFGLNTQQRETFEEVVRYCESQRKNIPISFLLGFFVAGIMARWYQMYMYIPNLTFVAFRSQYCIIGKSEAASREIRLCLMRYINLAWILSMRTISDQIANRFREKKKHDKEENSVREILENINKDKKVHLYYHKLITAKEISAMEKISDVYCRNNVGNYVPEYWVPLQWSTRLLQKSFLQGYIPDPRTLMALLDNVDRLREKLLELNTFSSISIPLVYTQVVIIAVYTYFILQLISSQFIQPIKNNSTISQSHEVDMIFPFFTIIHFLFLLGWLKVAICVFNPFGDDDEDFPTSSILDSNLEVTKRIVSADNDMFPENLNPANIECKIQPGAELDNLAQVIEEIQNELENTTIFDATYEVNGGEAKNTRLKQLRNFLPCLNDKHSNETNRLSSKLYDSV